MDSVKAKMTLKFKHPVTVYALVIGGWFPLSLAPSGVLLIDRNILGIIPRPSGNRTRHDFEANRYWLTHVNAAHYKINPVLCAMEGVTRAIPTYGEFTRSFDEACNLIRKEWPHASLVEFAEIHYRAAYETIEQTHPRYLRESQFLVDVSPLLLQRKAERTLRKTEEAIINISGKCGLDPFSLPLLAALSCLYESKSGELPSIGRKIINPSPSYTSADAHNTLADLRSLEYLVAGTGIGEADLTFCTRDRCLAAFWSALKLQRGELHTNGFTIDLQLDSSLFPRLCEEEVDDLCQRLRALNSSSRSWTLGA